MARLSNNIDVVYPVKHTADDNLELRFSLRSLANIPHGKVYVFTDQPIEWLNAEQIIVATATDNRFFDVNVKLRKACLDSRISEDFLLMNDDFYILKPTDRMPYFADAKRPTLKDRYNEPSISSGYYRQLHDAETYLQGIGKPSYNFEMHMPMVVNKQKLLPIINAYVGNGARRSLYCNINGIKPTRMVRDCKIYDDSTLPKANAAFCSSFIASFYDESDLQLWLAHKFNAKCVYEKEGK